MRLAVLLLALATAAIAGPPPWQRTETREPCAASDPLRRPFFGDIHVHTLYSADAYIFGSRVDPRGAYDFMRGRGTVLLADVDEAPTRESRRIDRALDFGAVTDHAEFFGEIDRCATPGSPAYDETLCTQLRQVDAGTDAQSFVTIAWLFPLGIPNPPTQHTICTLPGVDCDAAAVSVWQEEQAASEEAYDRTSACTFTSFVGYEHTPSPLGRHRHRNVIFRNATVPAIALSHLDTPGGVPQGLWTALENQCLDAGTGCDALIIPHNSNLSGGEQWPDPTDATEALRRQAREPLVEIFQQKGSSECRFDRLLGRGVDGADELCTFEQLPNPHEGPDAVPLPIDTWPRRNLVRSVLKDGLSLERQLGVNPFQLGFTGGTDTHNGTGGGVAETGWDGAQGAIDATPARQIADNARDNPGGITAVWAEENSRDAIFSALRRRETYATSGTRPVVRFFGGELANVACGSPEFVRAAYTTGVPMGGELGPTEAAPRFAVWAVKDAGTAEQPGTDLQRIQIVKGWVDADGVQHERVVDVAGDAAAGGVDPVTCAAQGSGFAELCAVWEDPAFDPREHAFYYARVLETPVCRWTTTLCRSAGVDPLSPDCPAQAAIAGDDFASCCRDTGDDAFAEPLVQERAWSSPIWYRADTIGRAIAQVAFGRAGRDVLTLRLRLGVTEHLDPSRDALTIRVTDDDEILAVTLPPGTLRRTGAGRWRLAGRRNKPDGIAALSLVQRRDDTRLVVRTTPRDLASADRSDHMVTIAVGAGTWQTSHTRLWLASRDRLGLARRKDLK